MRDFRGGGGLIVFLIRSVKLAFSGFVHFDINDTIPLSKLRF